MPRRYSGRSESRKLKSDARPESQLRLLCAAILEAARLREDGYPIDVRVNGVAGYPPAIGVSLAWPSHHTISFVSTKFV